MKKKLQSIILSPIDQKSEQFLKTNNFKISGEIWISGHLDTVRCGGVLKNADFVVCSILGKMLSVCS